MKAEYMCYNHIVFCFKCFYNIKELFVVSKLLKPTTSYERALMQTCIFHSEVFEEHQKHCEYGCDLCAPIRKELERAQSKRHTSIANVPYDECLELRAEIQREDKIRNFYPSVDDIRLANGAISREVYLVLQVMDFSDSEIRKYFHINHHEWQNFKKREFPNWLEDRDDILSEEAQEAYLNWRAKHNVSSSKYAKHHWM